LTTNADLCQTSPIFSYLLRGLCQRIDWNALQEHRRRNLRKEISDALLPLAISTRSPAEFLSTFATRLEINLSGGGFLDVHGDAGKAPPVYAIIPRRFLPREIAEIARHPASSETHAVLQWNAAARLIDFGAMRMLINESPDRFVTFAFSPEQEGEEEFVEYSRGAAEIVEPWTAQIPANLISPRCYRTVWQLLSPLAHGHDVKTGNVTMFRRERTVCPRAGSQALRPMFAGNAVRGMLRDRVMGRQLRLLGIRSTELPPERAHALFAGGSIDKGADGSAVNLKARRVARASSPAWDLFAGCIDQQIMRGVLRMHDALLLCRENAWILYEQLHPMRGAARLSYDEFQASLQPADNLTQLRLATRMAHREFEGAEGSQMIFNTEVVLAGAQFAHSFQLIDLDGVSELAASCMADLLEDFRDDAFVGAKNAAGLGRIAFDAYEPGDAALALPSPELYRRWIAEHAEEVRAWLMPEKSVDSGGGEGPVKAPKLGRGGRRAGSAKSAPADAAPLVVVDDVAEPMLFGALL
jgi:hypothetical protein